MITQGPGSHPYKGVLAGLLVGGILLIIGAAAFLVISPNLQTHTMLRIGDGVFTATVVKTEADRERGLSGTSRLAANKAMLFVFDSDNRWPIWMKDMNYPIDVVWLNSSQQVVYVVKDAVPESYPKQFTPPTPARYVIELAAGTVNMKSIRVGSQAVFDENTTGGLGL